MRMRVWWIPALPGPAFHRDVKTVEEGHRLLDAIVDYTRYLEQRGLCPDYTADVGGLQVLVDDEWVDAEFEIGDDAEWTYDGKESAWH